MTTLEEALGKNTTIYKDVLITKVSGFYERGLFRTYDYVELDNGVILENLGARDDLWEVIDNNFSAGTRTDLYVDSLLNLRGGYRYDGRLVFDKKELVRFTPKRDEFFLFFITLVLFLASLYSLFIGSEGFIQGVVSLFCVILFGGITYLFIHTVMRKMKYRGFFLDLLEQNKKEYNDKRMAELKAKQSNT